MRTAYRTAQDEMSDIRRSVRERLVEADFPGAAGLGGYAAGGMTAAKPSHAPSDGFNDFLRRCAGKSASQENINHSTAVPSGGNPQQSPPPPPPANAPGPLASPHAAPSTAPSVHAHHASASAATTAATASFLTRPPTLKPHEKTGSSASMYERFERLSRAQGGAAATTMQQQGLSPQQPQPQPDNDAGAYTPPPRPPAVAQAAGALTGAAAQQHRGRDAHRAQVPAPQQMPSTSSGSSYGPSSIASAGGDLHGAGRLMYAYSPPGAHAGDGLLSDTAPPGAVHRQGSSTSLHSHAPAAQQQYAQHYHHYPQPGHPGSGASYPAAPDPPVPTPLGYSDHLPRDERPVGFAADISETADAVVAGADEGLVSCRHCARTFSMARIAKHESVCVKGRTMAGAAAGGGGHAGDWASAHRTRTEEYLAKMRRREGSTGRVGSGSGGSTGATASTLAQAPPRQACRSPQATSRTPRCASAHAPARTPGSRSTANGVGASSGTTNSALNYSYESGETVCQHGEEGTTPHAQGKGHTRGRTATAHRARTPNGDRSRSASGISVTGAGAAPSTPQRSSSHHSQGRGAQQHAPSPGQPGAYARGPHRSASLNDRHAPRGGYNGSSPGQRAGAHTAQRARSASRTRGATAGDAHAEDAPCGTPGKQVRTPSSQHGAAARSPATPRIIPTRGGGAGAGGGSGSHAPPPASRGGQGTASGQPVQRELDMALNTSGQSGAGGTTPSVVAASGGGGARRPRQHSSRLEEARRRKKEEAREAEAKDTMLRYQMLHELEESLSTPRRERRSVSQSPSELAGQLQSRDRGGMRHNSCTRAEQQQRPAVQHVHHNHAFAAPGAAAATTPRPLQPQLSQPSRRPHEGHPTPTMVERDANRVPTAHASKPPASIAHRTPNRDATAVHTSPAAVALHGTPERAAVTVATPTSGRAPSTGGRHSTSAAKDRVSPSAVRAAVSRAALDDPRGVPSPGAGADATPTVSVMLRFDASEGEKVKRPVGRVLTPCSSNQMHPSFADAMKPQEEDGDGDKAARARACIDELRRLGFSDAAAIVEKANMGV